MKISLLSPRRVAVVALVAASVPFASISSADASTSLWGCTVNPERPVWDHTNPANGRSVIRYDLTVTCAAGRTVEIDQHIHEQDGGVNPDDHIFSTVRSRHFSGSDTITMWWEKTLEAGEIGAEEMYQTMNFRVTMDDLSQSGWSSWEDSPVQAFPNP
jgi:hypothetical protein